MKVKILPLDPKFKIPYKKRDDDFCFDVVATSEEEIAPGVWKYGLGFAAQIERGEEDEFKGFNLSIDLRPRSGVYETGMVLSNCEGTIDEPYTGPISAIFYKVIPDGVYFKNGDKSGVVSRYKVGERIGQIKIGFTVPMQFEIVNALSPTSRNDAGFNSSGRK